MPIQNAQFSGGGGDPLAISRAMEMKKAQTAYDAANSGQTFNNIMSSIMSFIPVVGPIFGAIGKGIGDIVSSKERNDAQGKMNEIKTQEQQAQKQPEMVQGSSIGSGSQTTPNDVNSYLNALNGGM